MSLGVSIVKNLALLRLEA